MSSKLLFLLLLLLVIFLLTISRLRATVRGYATRAVNLVARVPVSFTYLRAWALRRLFQTPEAQPLTTIMDANESTSRWNILVRESNASTEKYLHPGIDINLATFARCVTFRVFSIVFLGVDPDALVFENVQQVTGALSDFYDDGQGSSTLPPEAQSILYEWLPRDQFPSSLDRILPVYETLWRIVATLVVTSEDDETKVLRWVMLDFRDNPRDRQYRSSLGANGRSVLTITDEVVSRLTPIARPQRTTPSDWPLGCIRNASRNGSTTGNPPTVEEALKFAALLASIVIGRIGVRYGMSGGDAGVTHSQAPPWDGRRIFGVNKTSSGHVAIDVVEKPSYASTSKQVY